MNTPMRKQMAACTARIFLTAAASLAYTITTHAATFSVTSTNDSGAGSLRQAVLDANAAADADIITFAIPGTGPHTIALASRLADITQPLTIDGFTQPGASANTLPDGNNAVIQIRLDGVGAFGASGLRLRAPGCQVRGLSITRFAGEGVVINGGSNCIVAGNFIGLAPDGVARANNGSGVQIFDLSPANRIGGTAPADRNVLSGNFTAGVHLIGVGASNNVVEGNFIGTSPDGSVARPNFVNGVYVQDAPRNRIGGGTTGARNVISGNSPAGVSISGSESVGNLVVGNFIGPRADGTTGLASQNGVTIDSGATANRVGGSAAGEGNVISGNGGYGLRIDFASTGNLVVGNRIGVGPTGSALQNGGQGILIRGSGNRLGGAAPGEGNEIANNAPGIEVELGTGNAIRGNSIHDNRPRFIGFGGLGIDLAPFGMTANDAGDADGGVNLLQNFPLLNSTTASGASTRVQGTLNSRASATFALDFFSNPDCDPSGNGEGLKYLGSTSVSTDGNGNASFDVTLPVAAEGRQITATATDADGNTSEFSPCFAATIVQPPQTFFVTNTNDSGPGSLRQALLDAQASPASANNIVAFNIDGAGTDPIIIRPTTPLDSIFEGVTIDGFTQPGSSANTLADGNNTVWRIRLDGSLLGTGANGLTLNADGCLVRGLEVTGFRGYGIRVASGGDSSVVEGCRFFGNQTGGVLVDNAGAVTVGGNALSKRNLIHGNGGAGLQIAGAGGINNIVNGNFIGIDPAGARSGNSGGGVVFVDSASGNLVGGTAAGAGNRIAFNNFAGVAGFSGVGNDILGNSIVGNAGLGIELFAGANGNLAAPAISAATILANGVQCSGTFTGQPNTTYTLHTYSARSPNAEGEFYLGEATATTGGSGVANFTITTGGIFVGRYLTVTVTGVSEGTSEFSVAFTPTTVRPPATFTVTTTADDGPGSLRQVLVDANYFPVAGRNAIAFNIPGTGPHRINLLSTLPAPTQPLIIDGHTQPGANPNTSSNRDNAVLKIQLNGSLAVGHGALEITNAGNTIRGLSFTGFGADAIFISGPSNRLEGNWIGVAPNGAAGSNGNSGITIVSSFNVIGGTNPAARNIISANEDGILLAGAGASNNVIVGNFIGVAPGGTNALGNTEDGVRILDGASWNLVGDPTNAAGGNVITFNGEDGVSVDSGRQNAILLNRISRNARKNIFVATSANDGVRPPEMVQAYTGSLVVKGKVSGLPNTVYRIDVYADDTGNPNNPFFNRLGKRHLSSFEITTDGSGNRDYERTLTDVERESANDSILTTSTCENNTSEESNRVPIVPGNSADLKIEMSAPTSPVLVGDTISYVITVMNNGPSVPDNLIPVDVGLSPGLEFVSATGGLLTSFKNGVVTTFLGELPVGGTAQIVVTAKAIAPGQMLAAAKVDATDKADPFPANNSVIRDIVVRRSGAGADLQVSTSASSPNATPGTAVNVVSAVHNKGANVATGVMFLQSVPAGAPVATVNSTKGTCHIDDGVVTCDIGSLAPGEQVTVTVGMRIETSGPTTRFEFGSVVTTTGTDNNPFNNFDFAAVALQMPELNIWWDGFVPTISWTGPTPGVELETAEDLELAEWLDVPVELIAFLNGSYEYQPEIRAGEGQGFYRLVPTEPLTPFIQLFQLFLNFDLAQVPFSDWGMAEVTFVPQAGVVQYLNLSLPCPDGSAAALGFTAAGQPGESNDVCWVVENVPLITNAPTNRPAKVTVNFPIQTNGNPMSLSSWGYGITTNMLRTPPPLTNRTPWSPRLTLTFTGTRGRPTTWWPATPLIGGGATNIWTAKPFFPNIEQGLNEDVPASVFNSLTYLKTYLTVTNLPRVFLTLTNMMEAVGWEPGGVPEGFLGLGTWVDRKKEFMRTLNIHIQTIETNSIQGAIWALTNCYNVEIWMEGHTASIVAIADIGNGDYAITIQHDTLQGAIGGCVQEIVIFDSGSRRVYGSTWARNLEEFVIERPGPPP